MKSKSILHSRFLHIIELLILAILFTVLILNISSFFQNVDNQKNLIEFKKNSNYTQVEEWMSLHFISKEFNINKKEIKTLLNFETNNRDGRIPLNRLCEVKEKKCSVVIQKLNDKIQSNKKSHKGAEKDKK